MQRETDKEKSRGEKKDGVERDRRARVGVKVV